MRMLRVGEGDGVVLMIVLCLPRKHENLSLIHFVEDKRRKERKGIARIFSTFSANSHVTVLNLQSSSLSP